MSRDLTTPQRPGVPPSQRFDVTTVYSEKWLTHLTEAAKKATRDEDTTLVADLRAGCMKAKSEKVTILTKHYNQVIALAGVKPESKGEPNSNGKV